MFKPSFFTVLRRKNQIPFVRVSSLSEGQSLSNESMEVQYFVDLFRITNPPMIQIFVMGMIGPGGIWNPTLGENFGRSMWNEIIVLKNRFSNGEWCIGGDFNVVTYVKERKGSLNLNYGLEMPEFSEFIYDSNLVDVHLKDNKYNWFSGDGLSMSRIYRFLLPDALIHSWGVISQRIGKRDISDHCPV
ncbi:hypothetical protein KIW84_057995 [Lathyrus oleraceus]|uniref:Uncharacterized protein n=1 Tax=Pisum sativum TaxID=3888 RepID=A0A9D5ANP7_PEA|nr:hypothetical protein KIW84_057995 [Pisum sativum]